MTSRTCKMLTALLAAVMSLVSCSDKDVFKVSGTLAGGETLSMRFVYNARDAVHMVHVAARDGKFEMEGNAPTPTVIDILANDGKPMGHLYVVNGDKIECRLNHRDPYDIEIKGNEVDERWAQFIRDNVAAYRSPDPSALNKAVASYVEAHPSDVLSTLLMVTTYRCALDYSEAGRLMALIDPQASPSYLTEGLSSLLSRLANSSDKLGELKYYARPDSIYTFSPSGADLCLIAFTMSPSGSQRDDSIISLLRESRKLYPSRKLGILDLSCDADTFVWRRAVRPDSATWTQGWLSGSIMASGLDSLGLPSIPCFLVADSAGTVLYRGGSTTAVASTLENLLK